MVKSDKLDSKKQSGISPFLYILEVWPEDAATQNIETTKNGNKLKSKMRVLEGDEVPEQLMIWLKDFEDKIFKNISLSAPAKLAFLRRLIAYEAQTILSQLNNTIEYQFQVDETSDPNKQLYAVIIGNDLLYNMGINILFKERQIQLNDDKISMKEIGSCQDKDMCDMLHSMYRDSPPLQEAEERQDRIIDCNYLKVDIDAMVADLDINDSNKEQLKRTLKKFKNGLFDGGLGTLKNCKPAHIKFKPGATPYKGRYYNLPKAYEYTCKKEIQRMVDIGVIEEVPQYDDSPWASLTFGLLKKTGDVRIITDFQELNKWVEVNPFPLPRISEILQKLERFKSATALDLSLGFYSIPLDKASQKLCSTIPPWGKYKYKRMPMGVSCAPSIFQSIMIDTLRGLDVLVYCDDILVMLLLMANKEGYSDLRLFVSSVMMMMTMMMTIIISDTVVEQEVCVVFFLPKE